MAKIRFYILLFAFLLAGCKPQVSAPVSPRLITGVHVTREESGDRLQLHYTQPEQIDAIVHYLTGLHPYGIADTDPERVSGVAYRIELQLSDGTSHIYRQRADRYFSKDCQTWRLIDPEKAARFQALLQ